MIISMDNTADVAIRSPDGTVKGECTARVQKIFMESTEAQAVFFLQFLEFIAQNMKMIR